MKHYLFAMIAVACLVPATPAAAQTAHPSFKVEVRGRGPAMILIPGLLSSGAVWNTTVERYQGRYTMHVLTLAGFGGPPPIGEPFLSRVRDELIRYIRDEKIERPILVGHSLGGFLAFWVAATAPQLIGGMVAVDGVPYLPALGNQAATPAAMSKQAEQMKSIYASMSQAQLVAQSRMSFQAMITDPANVELASKWAEAADAATAGIAVAEMFVTDLRDEITKITAPVLLIAAPGNAPEPMRPGLEKGYLAQVAKLPAARVKMAGAARHFVMFDDPKFFFTVLDEFLAEVR
jgi:N-formylmaleamate deformylase